MVSLVHHVIKNKVAMQTQDMPAGKTKSLAAKNITNTPTTAPQAKDSASIAALPPQTEVTEKRRAF